MAIYLRSNGSQLKYPYITAKQVAQRKGKNGVVALLEAFKSNPTKIKWRLRVKLGIYLGKKRKKKEEKKEKIFSKGFSQFSTILEYEIARSFLCIVMLTDGYFSLKQKLNQHKTDSKIRQFYGITVQLPMELQMVICNRIFGFHADLISVSIIDKGLREIVGENKSF